MAARNDIHSSDSSKAKRVLLFADIAESTRLLDQFEDITIARWRNILDITKTSILATRQGRFVKSLGDGFLADFEDARQATAAAFDIQNRCAEINVSLPYEQRILLRIGMETGELIIDEHDVYGRSAMIGARLMTLAGPGEIVISASLRNQLTADLDADVEDLGDCYVKHLNFPIRAYRIGPPGPKPFVSANMSAEDLMPSLAVIPFKGRFVADQHHVLGEVLAEEMIRVVSRSNCINVISRLSTTAFRDRNVDFQTIQRHLKATYVLSGAYRVNGNELQLDAELADAKNGHILWVQRLKDHTSGLLGEDSNLINQLVHDVNVAVSSHELRRVQSRPMPTIESYSLLLAAISLMHSTSLSEFKKSHEILSVLIERSPRNALPNAWLANWHVLGIQQGWCESSQGTADIALDYSKRAVDSDPECSLALAVDGMVHTHLLKRIDIALKRYDMATKANPNDALAWLHKGTSNAFMGNGKAAVEDTRRALEITPLDPNRYFFDSLSATAYLAAREYDSALDLAERSLRANRNKTSTLRAKLVAEWQLGHRSQAKKTSEELLRLEPDFSVDNWLKRSPSAQYAMGREWADVFRQAGVG